jgi:tape measure domain-containing protein
MGSALDDLNFEINANISTTMDALKDLGAKLDDVFNSVERIDVAFRNLGQSLGLPAAQVELLVLRVQPLLNTLAKAQKQADSLEESFTRKLMARALEEHNKKVITLADGTQRARYEMIRLADASQQLRIPTQAPRAPADTGGGVNFVRVTAAAAQLTMLAKVQSTMRSVGQSVASSLGRSSEITASAMTRFRLGLTAIPVNPALNVVKNGLDAVGSGAANAIDKLRGIADAILSDLPGAAAAAVGAAGNLNSALDSASATASKHVANLQRMQGSLNLLATVFPFAADAIARFRAPLDTVAQKAEHVADKLDEMNASVGTAAAEMRGKAYVMTGAWTDLSGSADLFGRSQYYALLPQRLLMREFEGGQRVVKAATYAWNFLSHPIHAVSLALGQSRAEWQDLNGRLPQVQTLTSKLSGALLGMVASAVKTEAAGQRLSSMASVVTSKFRQMTSPARAFVANGLSKISAAATPVVAKLNSVGATISRMVSSLHLGARSQRLFVQSAYLMGTATRATVSAMTPLVRASIAVGKGIWSIVSPAKSAAVSLLKLTGVQHTFIGKALGMKKAGDDASNTLSKIDAASASASKGVGGFGSRAGMMKTAAAGLLAGMVALGTSTAVATEKNAAIFGTMLHDVDQGAAVVKSIQGTQAAKFFDNQQLLDSGRLLYKAGVNATDLGAKTDQFSKIAVGASVDLGMLADRYMQGFSQGHFGLGQINDLAREGVAIYAGLEAATGKSGDELQKMIADGKIGMTEMDAALAHLTEGNGIYAGSLDAMANTTSGKMSMIKNNVSQALGSVMGVALQVLSPFGTAMVSMSEQFKSAFESFRGPVIYVAAAVAWLFGNFINLAKFAFTSFASFSVTAFNDFIYFFTTSLPAYLTWFGANWKQVFLDAGNLVLTVFQNMSKNIWAIMKGIWAFMKSGGQTELKFAFVPLLDGFKSTVSELPNVPQRAMSELEKNLQAQTESLGGGLADSFDQMLADASQSLSPTVEIKDSNGDVVKSGTSSETAADRANNSAAENKAILVRSSEGSSLIGQMQKAFGKGDKEKKAQDAQIQALQELKDIKNDARKRKPLLAGPGF